MLTTAQAAALEEVAKAFGWDRIPLDSLHLVLWSAFHYYVRRASTSQ